MKRQLYLISLFCVILIQCRYFPPQTEPLEIIPVFIELPTNLEFTFSATGGVPPYVYTLLLGSGSIDAATGVYTAPALSDHDLISLNDSENNICYAIAISYIPGATVEIIPSLVTIKLNQSITFKASGGVPPYTYSVVTGSGIINATTGVYVAPSSPSVDTVRVTDSLSSTDDATVKIRK